MFDQQDELATLISKKDERPRPGNLSMSLMPYYDGDMDDFMDNVFDQPNKLYSAELARIDDRWDLKGIGGVSLLKVNFTIPFEQLYSGEVSRHSASERTKRFRSIVELLKLLGLPEPITMQTHTGYCALFPVKGFVSLNWIQVSIATSFILDSYSASNIGLPVRI